MFSKSSNMIKKKGKSFLAGITYAGGISAFVYGATHYIQKAIGFTGDFNGYRNRMLNGDLSKCRDFLSYIDDLVWPALATPKFDWGSGQCPPQVVTSAQYIPEDVNYGRYKCYVGRIPEDVCSFCVKTCGELDKLLEKTFWQDPALTGAIIGIFVGGLIFVCCGGPLVANTCVRISEPVEPLMLNVDTKPLLTDFNIEPILLPPLSVNAATVVCTRTSFALSSIRIQPSGWSPRLLASPVITLEQRRELEVLEHKQEETQKRMEISL